MTAFADMLASGYPVDGNALTLGAALEGSTVHQTPKVRIPLAMINRHGLIAGATGTGKTKTLQLMAEQLSAAGVPVFAADVKGDLSGIAAAGARNDKVDARARDIGHDWQPRAMPTEFVSLSGKLGVQLRATVSSFGPLLLAKVLSLNETQSGVLAMVFRYADDKGLLLLDFEDLRAVLQFLATDEGKPELKAYGGMAGATVGVLLRKMIELEEQGAGAFFGEPEFNVADFLEVTSDGRGVVTCLELADVQDKPRLWSTFMMWLLAEVYLQLPEVGDLPKPKLVFFFDEAHLLFDDAPEAFMEQIERVVRLIRSKGVGVFFLTQTPKDVPEAVLAQLGNRVQHALRAHTPNDEAALRATVRTFPKTPFYDLEETLTSLGIGEAVVTGLDRRGAPTPVVAARLIPPGSRMGPLTPEELAADLRDSPLQEEYGKAIDRESAREMLAKRLEPAGTGATDEGGEGGRGREKAGEGGSGTGAKVAKAGAAAVIGALSTTIGRTIGREIVRGIFGLLGAKPPRTSRRRSRW